jgi:ferric-dicitrate binding protein FerR (iron transport regulator)
MNGQDTFDPKGMDLPASREFDETAALLAFAVAPRRPPAALKARLMRALRPAPRTRRAPQWRLVPVAAFAALLLVPVLKPVRRPAAQIVSSHGTVSISGRAAGAGSPLRVGETIAVEPEGEAIVRMGDRAVFRLSHGGRAVMKRAGAGIEISLLDGWALSAVNKGNPYAVVTAHGRIAALGTVFIVRVGPQRDYVCICRGSLRLTGNFPAREIASRHHLDVYLSGSAAPVPAGGPMDGHTDADIAIVEAALAAASQR